MRYPGSDAAHVLEGRRMARRRGGIGRQIIYFGLGFGLIALTGCALLIYWLGRRDKPGRAAKAPMRGATTAPISSNPPQRETPMPTVPVYDLNAIAKLFEVRLAAHLPDLGGELLLLSDQQPVRLGAELAPRAALPAGLRQRDARLEWTATHGVIRPANEATSPSQAVFIPPPDSRPVTVTAEFEITLEDDRLPAPFRVRQSASLQLLSALPSLGHYDAQRGMLDGYHVGRYLDPSRPEELEQYNIRSNWFERYPGKYLIPTFFYRVDRSLQSLRLSKNLTLGTFVIDFPWKTLHTPEGWQYIALDPNLVRKLEDLLALMRADGASVTTFTPIYGFRPPAFNLGTIDAHKQTTLKEPLSMHQYGRALDLIVDEDGDGQLDDLNGDGKFDVYDAGLIMYYVNILDRQYRAEGRLEMVGGAGLYWVNDFDERNAWFRDRHPRAPSSTAYVHVDTRGFAGEGGRLIRWADKDVLSWPDGTPIEWKNPHKEYWTSAKHPGALRGGSQDGRGAGKAGLSGHDGQTRDFKEAGEPMLPGFPVPKP